MDAATAALWDQWADRKIETALRDQAEWMKQSLAEAFAIERASVQEELGSLRAEVEVFRAA
jgi:hypothetical protein